MFMLMRCVPIPLLLTQAPSPPPMPLTLQVAVEYAQNNLPAVRAALAQSAANQAGVDLARTSFLPRTDILVAANRATRNNVFGHNGLCYATIRKKTIRRSLDAL